MSFMSKITTAAAVAAFSAVAVPAANAAVIYSLVGTTAGGATFNRPTTTTALSAVGTAVAYNTFSFSTVTSGSYSFLLTSTGTPTFDTFLVLYSGTFNPASPLANIVTLNDDFNGNSLTQSGFTVNLDASQSYIAVLTGFSNTSFGSYSFTISDNVAAAVPEPASWGLMIAGFGMVGGSLRARRRSAKVSFA